MYANPLEYLIDARKNGYAIGAFNIENMEMVQAIARAAFELRAPLMMQTTPSTVKYGGLSYCAANVKTAAELNDIPITLHLDHCEDYDAACEAMRCGYNSVMIDGSKLPFEDNIALTRKTVEFASALGIPVEAELGTLAGKEDGLVSETSGFTDPDEAVEFVERTGISSLAVSIGTAHGLYKGEPKINIPLLEEIAKRVSIPLVLHGGSGLPDDIIKECIRHGISKVNYATELRIAFSDGVREVIAADSEVFDPKKYMAVGRERVAELVRGRIELFGSRNKI